MNSNQLHEKLHNLDLKECSTGTRHEGQVT